MENKLDDLTWIELNYQNRIVERTLKICGMTINDIKNKIGGNNYEIRQQFN